MNTETKTPPTNRVNYFLDTEFIEDGRTIDLISIGIVVDDSTAPATRRTLYLQNSECDFSRASDWVWRNVFPHLAHFDMHGRRACTPKTETYDSGLGKLFHTHCPLLAPVCPWATRQEIAQAVKEFCNPEMYGKPMFWGYYADYDWVVFCQLFGSMIDLPKGFPMYCRDIKQWVDQFPGLQLPKTGPGNHNALEDALQVRDFHAFLSNQHRP